MKNSPTISIICPVYNVEKYLPSCLESIKKQTFTDFECILIDDGSTDSSNSICNSISKTDYRFRVIHQQNQGYQTVRNVGLKSAKGQYIQFIDSDDYIHPQTLEIMLKSLNEGDYDFSMIIGKATFKQNISPIKIPNIIEKKVLEQNYLMKGLFNLAKEEELQYQVIWNKLYKKEILQDIYFIKTASEDTEFNCRVYQRCNKAILINLPLYNWLQNNNSITHKEFNINNIDIINSYYAALNEIPKENKLYRAYCIEKLYKKMINVRHYAKKTPYRDTAIKCINEIKEKTITELLYNNKLIICKKFILLLFYFSPFIYNIFIYFMEIRAKYNEKLNSR